MVLNKIKDLKQHRVSDEVKKDMAENTFRNNREALEKELEEFKRGEVEPEKLELEIGEVNFYIEAAEYTKKLIMDTVKADVEVRDLESEVLQTNDFGSVTRQAPVDRFKRLLDNLQELNNKIDGLIEDVESIEHASDDEKILAEVLMNMEKWEQELIDIQENNWSMENSNYLPNQMPGKIELFMDDVAKIEKQINKDQTELEQLVENTETLKANEDNQYKLVDVEESKADIKSMKTLQHVKDILEISKKGISIYKKDYALKITQQEQERLRNMPKEIERLGKAVNKIYSTLHSFENTLDEEKRKLDEIEKELNNINDSIKKELEKAGHIHKTYVHLVEDIKEGRETIKKLEENGFETGKQKKLEHQLDLIDHLPTRKIDQVFTSGSHHKGIIPLLKEIQVETQAAVNIFETT